MRNLRKLMNFDVTSGFVSMSDMFSDVCIFVTFMLPFFISSSKMMPFDGDVFCGLVPAATKVCVSVNFDGLVPFGIVDDPVILSGQQVFA
jgi:hypothetical protein